MRRYKEKLTKYINWKYAKVIRVNQEEMDSLFKKLDIKLKAKSKTKLSDWCKENTWRIEKVGNYLRLYTYKEKRHFIYTTNSFDDGKNDNRYQWQKIRIYKARHFGGGLGCRRLQRRPAP